MLGIVVLILLGFLFYHYRPRNLETKFKQSLLWSEFAKGCFICQPIFLIALQCAYIIFMVLYGKLDLQFWTQHHNILLYPFDNLRPYSIVTIVFVFAFPVISAWLTHKILVEPLREEKVPRQNLLHLIGLFSIMSIIGPFSVYFIELLVSGVSYYIGYERILEIMLNSILHSLPVFSILLIGIGAVEISGYKLRKYEIDKGLST